MLTYHSHALNVIAVSVLSVPITQGMMCSAHAVQLKLESQNILERAFAEYPVSLCGGAVTYVLKKLKRQNTRTIHILSLSPYGYMSTRLYPLPPSCKGYHLVLTGHSLGAGVASLLAVLFKPKHPTLHCYAYSPPGCVIRYC